MFNPAPHPRRQELVALAQDLAANRFASRAAHYDLNATFPCENFCDLHEAGLLALTIPSSLGGLDVDPVTYVETIKAIGRADGSTGLMLHMHSTISGIVGALGNDRQKERYLGEVARDGTP
jgi:alkylation response protein AidB-like acyl-CoA dehydrogenase